MAETPEIIPLRCGTIRAQAGIFEAGAEGEGVLPVYAFLITHPVKAPVVFDTGLHPSMDQQLHLNLLANFLPDGHDVAARLAQAGVGERALGGVILSHAHYDHAGGLPLLGDAPVYIHQNEVLDGVETGRDIRRTGDSFDLFGDGSVELFATPGHTAGHQSLRVRRFGGGHDVLTGDACYFCRALDRADADQPHAFDKAAYVASKKRFIEMRAAGDFIIPGHDPAFLDAVPAGSSVRVTSVSLD